MMDRKGIEECLDCDNRTLAWLRMRVPELAHDILEWRRRWAELALRRGSTDAELEAARGIMQEDD